MLGKAGDTPKGRWAQKDAAEHLGDDFWLLHPAQAQRKQLGHHYNDTNLDDP